MVATRARGPSRGGWRDTDVWLDPRELVWFGEAVPAAGAAPLLAGGGGAVALPGLSLGPRPAARGVPTRKRPGPSRRRRLATRLFPTVATLATAATAAPLLLASHAVEPAAAAPVAPGAQGPAGPAETRAQPATAPVGAPALPGARAGTTRAESEPAASAPAADGGPRPEIRWRRSEAIGLPHAGRLVNGVRLPLEGPGWATWDPVLHRVPNRAGRLFGTETLVRTVLEVVRGYRADHPDAPPVLVGDLSLRHGGEIDEHASHENGLDVDVYYPRADGRLRPPGTVGEIDLRLAQDLLDRFVAAGVEVVFVGESTPLGGPRGVVVPYPRHDDHMHVRIAPPAQAPRAG